MILEAAKNHEDGQSYNDAIIVNASVASAISDCFSKHSTGAGFRQFLSQFRNVPTNGAMPATTPLPDMPKVDETVNPDEWESF